MNRTERRKLSLGELESIKQQYFLIGAREMFYKILEVIKNTKGVGPATLDKIYKELEKVQPANKK